MTKELSREEKVAYSFNLIKKLGEIVDDFVYYHSDPERGDNYNKEVRAVAFSSLTSVLGLYICERCEEEMYQKAIKSATRDLEGFIEHHKEFEKEYKGRKDEPKH